MNNQEASTLREVVKSWQSLADMHEKSSKEAKPNVALDARIKTLRLCASQLDLTILMLTNYER
jgi:hypothetical protein